MGRTSGKRGRHCQNQNVLILHGFFQIVCENHVFGQLHTRKLIFMFMLLFEHLNFFFNNGPYGDLMTVSIQQFCQSNAPASCTDNTYANLHILHLISLLITLMCQVCFSLRSGQQSLDVLPMLVISHHSKKSRNHIHFVQTALWHMKDTVLSTDDDFDHKACINKQRSKRHIMGGEKDTEKDDHTHGNKIWMKRKR